jgi:hypothetical protein
MPRVGVAGDICLRRPRPTQGCKANDDYDYHHPLNKVENIYALISPILLIRDEAGE